MSSPVQAQAWNLIGQVFPGWPALVVGAIAGLGTLLLGLAVARWAASRRFRSDAVRQGAASASQRPRGTLGTSRRVTTGLSILRVFSGPALTGGGAVVGFLLGGTTGAFFGNPAGPLGFAIGYQQLSEARSDWHEWRATFIAGWMATWVGEVAASFGTKLFPANSPLSLSVSGVSIQLTVAQILAFTAGIIAAVLARKGGMWVASVSDVDFGFTMSFTVLVWLAGIGIFAIYEISYARLESLILVLVGRGNGLSSGEFYAAVPVAVAASVSLFFGALVIPWALGRKKEVKGIPLWQGISASGNTIEVVYGSLGAAVIGTTVGVTLGALLAFTYFAGLGASVPPWPIPAVYICICAALGILATSRATRWKSENEGRTSKPFFETVGEMTFGMVVGGSLTALLFLVTLVPAGLVAWSAEFFGVVVGGLLLVIILVFAYSWFSPFKRVPASTV